MTVTDDYANTLNYMLGTKTNRTNPGRFARRDCYIFFINYQVLGKGRSLTANAIYLQVFKF